VAIDLSGGGAADSRASQAGKILTATKYERTQEGALSTIKVDSEGEKLWRCRRCLQKYSKVVCGREANGS